MYRPIRDYAIIGNLRSAALVSKDGSIDWAPAPFIDSPSVFASLLDDEIGGYWQIAPDESYSSSQRYDGNSNILITHFKTDQGVLEVTDFIPIEREKTFLPAEEDTTFRIHRKITCLEGSCAVRIVFMPRFDYARGKTTLKMTPQGIYAEHERGVGILSSPVPLTVKNDIAEGTVILGKGTHEFFVFRYNAGEIDLLREEKMHHTEELQETRAFWEEWVHRCDIKQCPVAGPWHERVVRSSLLLKILFFEPVGTIAAAPTTSLPETIGGTRNWDYRFTWIRDSAFTLAALFRLGYVKEAKEYANWLLGMARDVLHNEIGELQVLYNLRGGADAPEEELSHLKGYRDSRPVRIGNAASKQKQWDIYGNILDVMWTTHLLEEDHELSVKSWETLRAIGNYVVAIWREPDEGLWEARGKRRHFVYSKVLSWVALDRAVKIASAHNFDGEIELWKRERDLIRQEVFARGWNEKKQSFTQTFDSDFIDASALSFSALGFVDGRDPKMIKTIACVESELGAGSGGLLYRYNAEDNITGVEGAFFLASFWLVDALALAGEYDRAVSIFEKIIAQSNHVGLFSEEIDPNTNEFLGNFPQAYTHIGLINSAFILAGLAQKSKNNHDVEI